MFDSQDFLPHGICLSWEPALIWLHVVSDTLIGLSYYSIPLALTFFVQRRRDFDYGWVLWLFSAFILACGTTHFFGVWTLWVPDYEAEGIIKGVTAAVSMATAIALWPLLPKVLALPSPHQLTQANQALQHEIEERRQAEERVRASEEHYMGLFNNLAEGLFVIEVRPDGCFVLDTINPAHARATGLDASRIKGRPLEDFLSPATAASVIARYQACIAQGSAMDYEETLDLPAGRRTWHTMLMPVRDRTGRITQLLGSGRDITERKHLEAELVQASKLATIGTMAAGIAHELSQPLNIIRLWTENARLMAAEGAVIRPDDTDRLLALISEQTERMGAIIDHMRTFSRRDGAKTELFDPAKSVRSAVKLVERQFTLKNIAIATRLDENACAVRGRPLQLEQVVLNLLSNAADAILAENPAGGGIDIRLCFDRPAQSVILTTSDTGGGLDDALLPRIFDPFFTTKEVGYGSGLGLSISYGIINAMNGQIKAGNVLLPGGGKGACFTITLPATALLDRAEEKDDRHVHATPYPGGGG